MMIDPIVEQIHKRRQEYMERFHYDFEAVIRDIRTREAADPERLVQPPKRVARSTAPAAAPPGIETPG